MRFLTPLTIVVLVVHVIADALMPEYNGADVSLLLGGIVGGQIGAAAYFGTRSREKRTTRSWWSMKA